MTMLATMAGQSAAEHASASPGSIACLANLDSATLCPSWAAHRAEVAAWNGLNEPKVLTSLGGERLYVVGTSSGSFAGDHTTFDFLAQSLDSRTGETVWETVYDFGPALERVNDAVLDPAGSRLFLAGLGGTTGDPNRIAVLALDASTGDVLWSVRETGAQAHALQISPDGAALYLSGDIFTPETHIDFVTVALDTASGVRLWEARYDGPEHGMDGWTIGGRGTRLAVDPSGSRVYVTGNSEEAGNQNWDFVTMAYDALTGLQLWIDRFAGPTEDDYPQAIAVSPTGDLVFVTGASHSETAPGGASSLDAVTLAYGSVTGERVWTARLDGPSHGNDLPGAMVTNGNQVFVAGGRLRATVGDVVSVPTPAEVLLLAYDARDGRLEWTADYPDALSVEEAAFDVALSPNDAAVYIVGSTTGLRRDYLSAAYDTRAGTPIWSATFNVFAERAPELSNAGANPNPLVCDGEWKESVCFGSDDLAFSVAVGPGHVYVSGLGFDGVDENYVTLAYAVPR